VAAAPVTNPAGGLAWTDVDGQPEQVPPYVRGIAHDLNNALGVIRNYAAFLEQDLAGNAELQDFVREIADAAARASALTDGLLSPPVAAAAAPSEPAAAAPEAPATSARSVLVVDDDAATARITTRILEREDYTVLTAMGPEEALEVLRERGDEIAVVVTDVVMPGSSGIDLPDWIAQVMPETAVLRTSGYPKESLVARGVVPADADLLPKPFTAEELLELVRAAAGGGSAAGS
jgi:CheY-like chemotaxis protein